MSCYYKVSVNSHRLFVSREDIRTRAHSPCRRVAGRASAVLLPSWVVPRQTLLPLAAPWRQGEQTEQCLAGCEWSWMHSEHQPPRTPCHSVARSPAPTHLHCKQRDIADSATNPVLPPVESRWVRTKNSLSLKRSFSGTNSPRRLHHTHSLSFPMVYWL